jgi:hypothetical protein
LATDQVDQHNHYPPNDFTSLKTSIEDNMVFQMKDMAITPPASSRTRFESSSRLQAITQDEQDGATELRKLPGIKDFCQFTTETLESSSQASTASFDQDIECDRPILVANEASSTLDLPFEYSQTYTASQSSTRMNAKRPSNCPTRATPVDSNEDLADFEATFLDDENIVDPNERHLDSFKLKSQNLRCLPHKSSNHRPPSEEEAKEARITYELAQILEGREEYGLAEELYRKTIKEFLELGELELHLRSRCTLAKLLHKLQRNDKACEMLLQVFIELLSSPYQTSTMESFFIEVASSLDEVTAKMDIEVTYDKVRESICRIQQKVFSNP